jgi:hypothetical protein
MSVSFMYLLLRQVMQMLTQLAGDDKAKDVELLVLRHRVSVAAPPARRTSTPVAGTPARGRSPGRVRARGVVRGRSVAIM